MIFVLVVVDVAGAVVVDVVVFVVDVVFVASERPRMEVLADVLRAATPHRSKRAAAAAAAIAHVEVFRIVHR